MSYRVVYGETIPAWELLQFRERLNVAGEFLCGLTDDAEARAAYAAVLYVQSSLKLDADEMRLAARMVGGVRTMKKPQITEAQRIADRIGADAVVIIAFGDGQMAGASYGATKHKSLIVASWMGNLIDTVCDEHFDKMRAPNLDE